MIAIMLFLIRTGVRIWRWVVCFWLSVFMSAVVCWHLDMFLTDMFHIYFTLLIVQRVFNHSVGSLTSFLFRWRALLSWHLFHGDGAVLFILCFTLTHYLCPYLCNLNRRTLGLYYFIAFLSQPGFKSSLFTDFILLK